MSKQNIYFFFILTIQCFLHQIFLYIYNKFIYTHQNRNIKVRKTLSIQNNYCLSNPIFIFSKKFWTVFQNIIENIDETKYSDPKHSWKLFEIYKMKKVKKIANFSASFLRDNEDWIQ